MELEYSCCIRNCEYNNEGQCSYCGDYWTLNSEDCISFEEKYVEVKL